MTDKIQLSTSTPFGAYEILAVVIYCLPETYQHSSDFSPIKVYRKLLALREDTKSDLVRKILDFLLRDEGETLDAAFMRLGTNGILLPKAEQGKITHRVVIWRLEEVRSKLICWLAEDDAPALVEIAKAMTKAETATRP